MHQVGNQCIAKSNSLTQHELNIFHPVSWKFTACFGLTDIFVRYTNTKILTGGRHLANICEGKAPPLKLLSHSKFPHNNNIHTSAGPSGRAV